MRKDRRQKIIKGALAVAAFLIATIGYPVVVDQGWLHYNPYILPLIVLLAGLLCIIALLHSDWAYGNFGRWIQRKGLIMTIVTFVGVGACAGAALGAGYYGLLRISETHIAELLNKERKPINKATISQVPDALLDYGPFEKVYDFKLGPSKGVPLVAKWVSYDVYEKATVAWVEESGEHYIFLHDSPRWIKQRTRIPTPDEQGGKYYVLKEREKYFKDHPQGLEPPIGGIMVLWEQDEQYWKNLMGWRIWGSTSERSVRYQRFESGYMIGPLPLYKYGGPPNHAGHPNAFVLMLFGAQEGEWAQPSTDEPSPKWDKY